MARPLIAAVLASVVLAGCGDDGGGGGGPIRFQLFGDPEELTTYRELLRAYETESGERVQLVPVPDREAHLTRLTTAFAGGRPPDVFLINHRNLGGFANRAVEPVAGVDTSGFFRVPLQAFTVDGRLQCVPQNVSNLVVYYNADRFRRAGVPLPRRGWTYGDMVAAARRLGRGSIGIEPSLIRAAPFVWSAGGELVDDEDAPTRFALDTPPARRGLQRLLDLRSTGLAPTAEQAASRDIQARFLDGELAMLFGSRRETPTLRTIDEFTWDVAPFPTIGRPVTVLHTDGFCVARGGDVDAARRFVAFASGPRGQQILARGGRTVPSLRRVAESRAFLDPEAAPRSSRVFLDQVRVLRRLPTTRNWTEIEDRVDKALESAFYGRISLDELLERIESETAGGF
jgi:multiple sugar transport system substrate-binding protein